MKQTTFQHPELRDANDNIIQQGAFGKNTALANATNDGWIDYVANDLEALYDNTMGGTGGEINTETITGKTGTITNLTATTVKAGTVTADALNGPLTGNVTGDLNGNVTGDVTGNLTGDVKGDLTGNVKGNVTGNVTGTADKAVADGNGNNIVNTYVTKSSLASSVTTGTGKVTTLTATDSTLTNLTVTGETTVPTANAGNSSKAIANTEFVAKSLASLVNGAPDQLNTLNELAKALGNNANFSATITAELAKKLNSTEAADTYATKTEARVLPGMVQAFAGTTIPSGWLLCDGSAVSRTTYANLYACIGTTYGSGNGSTTFNLPNLVDKFVEGSATAGTVKSAGLPNITGNMKDFFTWYPEGSGAITVSSFQSHAARGTANGNFWQFNFDASKSNAIYGNSATVQPPAVTMRYIIKY